MDYRRLNDICYVRIDKGEEIVTELLRVCREEGIASAVFTGIGGCCRAELQTFIPDKGEFETETFDGMLELVSLTGNVVSDGGALAYHAHAAFAYKDGAKHRMAAGHLKSATVLYTAEIELRPVKGGVITRKPDAETKTGFWCFE
jgi:hypothetical protein